MHGIKEITEYSEGKESNIFNKRKQDKSSIETQLIFSFIGFGYLSRIKSVHHQTFIRSETCNKSL
jgi:hypothetical protein